jgi:formylglycine-generating enzyme required for sulfatase activity
MGRTEVTVGAYQRFAAETGRAMPPAPARNAGWAKTDHPMVNVTWPEAREFCAWSATGLPTEEQWEYAARGGHPDWLHPWGNADPLCTDGAANGARFDDGGACRGAGPSRVASFGRNGYGLADMAGNVWEWCEDPWQPRYGDLPSTEEERDAPGGRQVLRGGSWVNGPGYLRISIRSGWLAGTGRDFIGFRCVREGT